MMEKKKAGGYFYTVVDMFSSENSWAASPQLHDLWLQGRLRQPDFHEI